MAKDIDVDLLKETVSSIKVKGTVVCDKAIKGYYGI